MLYFYNFKCAPRSILGPFHGFMKRIRIYNIGTHSNWFDYDCTKLCLYSFFLKVFPCYFLCIITILLLWFVAFFKIGRIEAHSLTVTQLAFSPAADLLLSVSRDRSWALHALDLDDQDQLSVTRIAFSDKKTSPHKRIIWTCCWSCDGKYFYTGSRDKLVVCWGSPSWEPVADPLALPDSVTALAAPRVQSSQYKITVGLDSGCIHLYSWSTTGFTLLQTLSPELAHHLTVTRLAFSPRDNSLLASSSTDHAVKIYSVSQSWQFS